MQTLMEKILITNYNVLFTDDRRKLDSVTVWHRKLIKNYEFLRRFINNYTFV